MRAALLLLLFVSSAVHAQSTRALIVTGLAGDPQLKTAYAQDAAALRDAVIRLGGSANVLSESSTPRADRAGIEQAFTQLASSTTVGDRVLIVFLGHASADATDARFNIPGPDVTVADIAQLLNKLPNRQIAFVMATTSSGAFLSSLAAPGRVLLAATRSATENEEVVFPRYFARAFAIDGADTDKDGGISIAEAFEYAQREVARFYGEGKRLATEHAVLDDNGDGKASLDTSGADGARARLFILRAANTVVMTDTLRALHAQRSVVEGKVADLKARKASMAVDAYDTELEKLLVELARIGQSIRAMETRQ